MAKTFHITQEDDHRIRMSAVRDQQKEQGMFQGGKFNTKVQRSAKGGPYKRRAKYRDQYDD
jgi:hypothetical protein